MKNKTKKDQSAAIITIISLDNFGNRLQNYALQALVEQLGVRAETLVNTTKYARKYSKFAILRKKINTATKLSLGDIVKKITKNNLTIATSPREHAFTAFNEEFVNFHRHTISEENVPEELIDSFDFFIAGSDQIWNPKLNNFSHVNLLGFAPDHKRIAAAPSLGVDTVTNETSDMYNTYVSSYQALSVREEAGKKILQSATGRTPIVLVDPTMTLSAHNWQKIENRPDDLKYADNEYILLFCLGTLPNYIQDYIEKNSILSSLPVVNILTDNNMQSAGPKEFLYLIRNAGFVITDSFHGSVFSIIFNRPFFVFDRKGIHSDMNSRIKTLLDTFDLESRYISEERAPSAENPNFEAINKTILSKQREFKEYLRNAFDESSPL